MTKRTLSLKRESLTDLTTDELTAVVGGDAPPTQPLAECLSRVPSCAQHTCFDCITRDCG